MKYLISGYAIVALVTFGFAATDPRRVCYDNWKGEVIDFCPSSTIVKSSLPAGLFWPAYWSWELADWIRESSK